MNITIVGGGFGGIKTALELSKSKEHNITLISDNKNFQYYPALFSTATGHSFKESWVPLIHILGEHDNVSIVIDKITKLDKGEKAVVGESGEVYHYDRLVLALGSVTTYFGIQGLDEYSYGIKTASEIRALQHHLWTEMKDGADTEKNYVIIGAGPTGVELAGALGQYLRQLRKHFNIRKKTLRITLIEASPRILPRLSESSSRRAQKRLERLGVRIQTGRRVQKQTSKGLIVDDRLLPTETVVWTSGVSNPVFYANNNSSFKFDERKKVIVDRHMQALKHVYVIGDNANTPYAGLAQTALHDAKYVAKHIKGSKKVYKPKYPPSVVPIGDNWALFEWGRLRFGGLAGGIMRRAADLIGYSDILPISWALGAWRSSTKRQMLVPPEEQM
jgi:NADH dehydrogenase